MKQKNELVLVEDFNIDTLREAFLQKRLYVRTPSTFQVPHTHEEGIRAILRYVSRIAHCASPDFRPVIGTLWEQILRSPELGHLFFLSRYRQSRGKPNWYRVNAVMTVLLEHNIYRCECYTAVQLHLLMEQNTRRNNHYTCMNRYLLERHQVKLLLQYTEHLRIHGKIPVSLQ